jgi:2-oxoisovalerate dehydrogenase E2 component (dihydrolipoyl transacylase)
VSRQEFRLPDLGEGLTEAELVSWQVAVGDTVTLNQIIAEVETEKAVVELPSPYAGTVEALLVEAGTAVEVGSPIIAITGSGPDEVATDAVSGDNAAAVASEAKVPVLVGYGPIDSLISRRHRRTTTAAGSGPVAPTVTPQPSAPKSAARPLAPPPVRYLARMRGVELRDVSGSGPGGLITREDVNAHLAAGDRPESVTPASWSPASWSPGDGPRETRTPIRGVRKHTAEAMVRSAFTAPHVTEFVTVDVTATVDAVATLRQHRAFDGVRVTLLTLVAKAVLLALGEYPSLNSSWDDAAQEIVTKHYVHLGIAAATPRGLVVPNIKEAHQLRLRELAESLAILAATAREGRSTPADLTGGTFTITNIGVFGVDGGSPILNPGEAGILCLGQVRRTPWEFEGEVALRDVVTLSLSFDHRLVDGKEGSQFLASVGSMLSDPIAMLALV